MTNQQINILKESLLLIERQELAALKNLVGEEITPSPAYRKNMERLVRRESSWQRKLLKNKKRKLLAILIAALLIFSSIFSVSAVREPIIEYAISVYEEFTHFFFEESTENNLKIIQKEYQVTWVPQDYTLTSCIKSEADIHYQWSQKDHYISFNQTILGIDSIHLNTEKSEVSTFEMDGQLYYYNNSVHMYFIIWTTNDYSFNLACSETIGWDNVLKILEGIQPI